MAITAFNDVSDGLEPIQRDRGHFIVNTSIGDNAPWIPSADGVWLQPCCFDVTSGGFSRFRRASETPFNLVYEARP